MQLQGRQAEQRSAAKIYGVGSGRTETTDWSMGCGENTDYAGDNDQGAEYSGIRYKATQRFGTISRQQEVLIGTL